MTKFSAIVPICILTVSGCAVFDNPEMSQQPVSPAPVIAVEEAPEPAGLPPIATPSVAPAPRSIPAADVRRVQMRLRDAGFDPGPIDGIAGPKTRSAFAGLAAGCGRLEKLPQDLPRVDAPAPKREEVVRIQTELRASGFNPGPIDGIYGPRTRALVALLPEACALAQEFGRGFDDGAEQTSAQLAGSAAVESGPAAVSQGPARGSDEAPRAGGPAQSAPRREETRILQLRLRDAGYDPGPFDGIMGARTRAALAQYEANQRNGKVKTNLKTTRISGQY